MVYRSVARLNKGRLFYRKNFPPIFLFNRGRKIKQMVSRFLHVFVGLMFLSLPGKSTQRADAFIIELYGRKAKVLSPRFYHPRTHLIIKNQTLASIVGRVENIAGEVKKYVSVRPDEILSFSLGMHRGERLFFIPLTPPLQAFELKIGNPSYEIPAQR